MIETKILSNTEYDITIAAECIQNGGLVIFPTETVYGLGANALKAEASSKIYAAKGRPSDNPLISHLAFPEDAEKICITSDMYYKLAERFMPGPLTIVLPKKFMPDGSPVIPPQTTGGQNTAAVRVPSDPIAHAFIKAAGTPIAAPSANLSGSPSPTTMRHVIEDMFGRVDCIIDGGDSIIGLESTIVMPKDDKLYLLRPGGITIEDLKTVTENIIIDPAVLGKSDGVPLAPGMKYRHYAPKSRVVILDGSDDAVYSYLENKKGCAILCYDSDTPLLKLPNSMSMGSKDDHLTQAHILFTALRDLDGADIIYVRMPSCEGIGLAVFNRLIKAAGYDIQHI